ncbi:hypothetical protein SAMN04488029_1477 [Reichenbachiella faecimaris]|uniref:His Kinase A (Phospho-acceptor) domain-containing protein n=1 Tax=Reichenbachiella faecimaris TaxID=692418 RepID=A0A1W2G9H3_REIFA|nr:HAMP domain-containing histidine kinase [Reichenbachiella faecimaris]SMD33112.1 hypothetical protein SAMN04488029_1477 [Reichenbachiella faecimaris]
MFFSILGEAKYFLFDMAAFKPDFNNKHIAQLGYAMLFGISSYLLGFVQFKVPGLSGVATDFREIPLLISLFYLKNPLYLIVECVFTTMNTAPNGSYLANFLMHFISLIVGYYYYSIVYRKNYNYYIQGLLWVILTLIYYGVFLAPAIIIVNMVSGISQEPSFWVNYLDVMFTARFEMVSSSFVTSIFLIQFQIRRSLEKHKKNLESDVKERTAELAHANAELKTMNDNLDQLVKKRTQKVHEQYDQMLKYANLNSHEVRAPLSRMQGLMSIIIEEPDMQSKMELIEKLKISSEELDAIVIQMNQILESELIKGKKKV